MAADGTMNASGRMLAMASATQQSATVSATPSTNPMTGAMPMQIPVGCAHPLLLALADQSRSREMTEPSAPPAMARPAILTDLSGQHCGGSENSDVLTADTTFSLSGSGS